jgi:hypothetical protein
MALNTLTTGSIIEAASGRDATFTGLSTMIVIKVGPNAVGAIQTLSVTEARTVTAIDEVGTDGHIDSAPTKSTDYTGTCERLRFDRVRLTEAFGRGFLHLKSMRIPFDIDIFDNWNGDGSNAIITTIKNVWFTNLTYTLSKDNWLIAETAQWMAEDMYSTLNGGQAATGGLLGPQILQINTIEQAADIGKLRGSLTAPGLINDFFTNF